MGLFDLLNKRKSTGQYDTEYFKNKVKIDELKEQQMLQRQREKISSMERKLGGGRQHSGFGGVIKQIGQNAANMGNESRKGRRRNMFGGYM